MRPPGSHEAAGSDVGWVIGLIAADSERDRCAHRSRLWRYSLANKVAFEFVNP